MKRRFWVAAVLFLALSVTARAERPEAESSVYRQRPFAAAPATAAEDAFRFDSSYEYGDVRIGTRDTQWTLYTGRLTRLDGPSSYYLETEWYERSRVDDQKVSIGADRILEDGSAGVKAGLANDADFISRFNLMGEVEKRLAGTAYWRFSGQFLDYKVGQVGLLSPGLSYYFGDHSIGASYNVSFTEGRGSAQWGSIRGRAALSPTVSVFGGAAVGRRLFDIDALSASQQEGYIVYAGVDLRLADELRLSFVYDHGREETPDFIKHGYTVFLSARF